MFLLKKSKSSPFPNIVQGKVQWKILGIMIWGGGGGGGGGVKGLKRPLYSRVRH